MTRGGRVEWPPGEGAAPGATPKAIPNTPVAKDQQDQHRAGWRRDRDGRDHCRACGQLVKEHNDQVCPATRTPGFVQRGRPPPQTPVRRYAASGR
jgi:hypothetical protein